jgi:hypothetical protein
MTETERQMKVAVLRVAVLEMKATLVKREVTTLREEIKRPGKR